MFLSCSFYSNAQAVKTSLKSNKKTTVSKTVNKPTAKKAKINWMTFEEAVAESQKNPKKIFLDVYTSWCHWCKEMDKSTFQDQDVADYMNKNFYAVKFNAEQREDIEFLGHTFKYVKNGRNGYHELAYAILQGKMSYPTTVYMDEELKIAGIRPGFASAEDMDVLMHYFTENQHKHIPFQDFQKQFVAKKQNKTNPETVKQK